MSQNLNRKQYLNNTHQLLQVKKTSMAQKKLTNLLETHNKYKSQLENHIKHYGPIKADSV